MMSPATQASCVTLLNSVCLQVSHPTQCFRGMHACKHVHPCIPVTVQVSVFSPLCALGCAQICVRVVVSL